MHSTEWSLVIPVSTDKVWEILREFNGMPNWHPAIKESKIDNGKGDNEIGAVRLMTMGNGGTIHEELTGHSDEKMTVDYTITESALPITDYQSRLEVHPVTETEQSFVKWSCTFNAEAEKAEEMIETLSQAVYRAGLEALREKVTPYPPSY